MTLDPNDMMMDLFRAEVESHSETLNHALLQLERDASDTSVYDSMMRAAHSIKGAARIVQVNAAVEVAHVMEDCFVAAQRGELAIDPNDFDHLLNSVDLLVRISEATKTSDSSWDSINQDVAACVQNLKNIRAGTPAIAQAPAPQQATPPQLTSSPSAPKAVPSSPSTSSASTSSKPATEPKPAPSIEITPAPAIKSLTLHVGPILDRSVAETLRVRIIEGVEQGIVDWKLDLSQTRDLDSVGLAFLAASQNYIAEKPGCSLRMEPLSAEMSVVLRMSGLASS